MRENAAGMLCPECADAAIEGNEIQAICNQATTEQSRRVCGCVSEQQHIADNLARNCYAKTSPRSECSMLPTPTRLAFVTRAGRGLVCLWGWWQLPQSKIITQSSSTWGRDYSCLGILIRPLLTARPSWPLPPFEAPEQDIQTLPRQKMARKSKLLCRRLKVADTISVREQARALVMQPIIQHHSRAEMANLMPRFLCTTPPRDGDGLSLL